MEILAVVVGVLVVLAILVWLFIRWHVNWLAQQSPLGVWTAEHGESRITLQFDQGSIEPLKEGVYRQITANPDGSEIREWGHWIAHLNQLRMLIMASDIKGHPRFGQDTVYRISYVGPEKIEINGPDRPHLVFQRAPDDARFEFEIEKEIRAEQASAEADSPGESSPDISPGGDA
jgi:hypothetical protein